MVNAIVFTSNSGYTRQYANLLGKRTNLPVFSLEDAKKKLPANSKILYLGWLMAGGIKGYKDAAKHFRIRSVCGVCMASSGSQLEEVRKKNKIPDTIPLFTLQGGFDIKKLHGIYKFMMTVMIKTAGNALAKKENRTKEEDDMLDMMLHGGNRVTEKNLADVLAWYRMD